MQKINIDEISLKILALLQENARLSFTEIGNKIGMTSSSVAERVKKLEESGVIQKYTTNIDAEKLGFPIMAIVMLSCSGAYTPKEQTIVNMLSKYYQVVECLRISGKNDFLIKVIVQSMDEFKSINNELGNFGQVETSFAVTTFIKNTSIDIGKMIDN